jgi:hypothetical protein
MGSQYATNLMQRIQPYAQAANQMIGNRMAPVLTPPSIQQSRTTLGTFGPKTVEGMELTYPSLTQRIGTATEPVRNYIANMPATQKAVGALTTIPGGAAVMKAFGTGETTPNMPATDVPAVISTDSAGNRTYVQPPVPAAPAAPVEEKEPTAVETAMAPPGAPKTEAELIDQQGKKGKLENRLDAYMKENLPVFEKYMGGDKEASQIQALFLLADAGLEYATKPARTGMMALANAFKRMPAGLAQIAAQEEARKTQIKGAALTSGLQTIAAEDKSDAAIRRVIAQEMAKGKDVATEDMGAGLTLYKNKSGQQEFVIDPKVVNSFITSRLTPQVKTDKEGKPVGFENPYARYSGQGQTLIRDKALREKIANENRLLENAISQLDTAITDYEGAFGPGAFYKNFKNNVIVPVTPLKADVKATKQQANIELSMNTAAKAIARSTGGDTGNLAVKEQEWSRQLLGDKPGKLFSDSENSLKRIMTVRTQLINQRLRNASQLGWVTGDFEMEVPNLGTPSDPIPQDKISYVSELARLKPSGTVYISTPQGVKPAPLSTFKE